jgi:hypothetical protein
MQQTALMQQTGSMAAPEPSQSILTMVQTKRIARMLPTVQTRQTPLLAQTQETLRMAQANPTGQTSRTVEIKALERMTQQSDDPAQTHPAQLARARILITRVYSYCCSSRSCAYIVASVSRRVYESTLML